MLCLLSFHLLPNCSVEMLRGFGTGWDIAQKIVWQVTTNNSCLLMRQIVPSHWKLTKFVFEFKPDLICDDFRKTEKDCIFKNKKTSDWHWLRLRFYSQTMRHFWMIVNNRYKILPGGRKLTTSHCGYTLNLHNFFVLCRIDNIKSVLHLRNDWFSCYDLD